MSTQQPDQQQQQQPHAEEDELSAESDPIIFKKYFKFLTTPWAKYCIISTWILVLILGLFFSPLLLQQTQLTIEAPDNSASHTAKVKMKKSFNTLVGSNYVLIFSQCTTKGCLNGTESIDTLDGSSQCNYECIQKILYKRYNEYKADHSKRFYNFSDLYTYYNTCTTYADDASFYPTGTGETAVARVNASCRENVRESFVSKDGTAAISVIQHEDDMNDVARHSLLDWLDDVEHDFNSYTKGRIHTRVTGEVALWDDMQEESKKTIESHLYMVPFILIIFGYTIGSWRLTLIPIIAMVICTDIAFMLLLPWASVLTVSTMTPTLMTSISLAMCIDYNLFMLVRFREEVGDERDVLRMSEVHEALRKTLRWSGEVVLVSGFILALSLMGYIFCSVEFLQSYGLGTAITVGCAIVINLSLTPSILLLFPSFFTQFGFNCRRTTIIDDSEDGGHGNEVTQVDSTTGYGTNQDTKQVAGDDKDVELSLAGADAKDRDTDKPDSDMKEEYTKPKPKPAVDFIVNEDDPFRPFEITEDDEANAFQRCWFVCGTWTTLFPCSLLIILAVYALILPITVEVGDITISYTQTLEVPRDSAHWETFGDIQDYFSSGFIGPMYLLIRAPSGISIFNYSYINDTSNFFKVVLRDLNHTVGQIDHVSGVSVLNGKFLGGNETAESVYTEYTVKSKLYHALVDVYAGKKNAEAYFSMLTHDDPNGYNCKRMVNRIRDVINPACRHMLKPHGYSCYYYSNTVETIDAIHDLYTTFPWILLVTMIVIFIIAGIIWKNKFLPLRLFLTIAMPMFMIYGMAVLVYQHGWLSWLNSNSVDRTQGIAWIIPLMTITLLFGLALDYDIFLWSRIDEYMKHGVPLRPAIVRGVFKTGSIITAAGLIMASAFSGLFFSTVPALNQAGFILVSSVLVDTFLIRTTLVPSILSISLTLTWHPEWQKRVYGWLGWPVPIRENKEQVHLLSDQQ